MSVNQGDILAGKFRVEKLLGSGGMGMVVAAHHLQLDEPVAIKFLLPEALTNAAAVGRFAREARAATKIKSEHVVRIIDIGSFDSGEPYIVMEYLNGQDLSQLLAARGPLPPDEVAEYILQACEAIVEAHVLGIVHRDLKPANLFVAARMDGTPLIKVLDFGISKVSTGPDLALTETSALMGSPLYMSPEQMASAKSVDARTDIWALGVILYELVTGKPPFSADTITELCAKVLQQEAQPVRAHRPELPPAMDEVIARCLKKSPAERYANVGELAIALAEIAPKHARRSAKRISGVVAAAGLSTAATNVPPSSDELPHPQVSEYRGTATAVSWGETAGQVPKRSVAPLIAGLVALSALGIVVAFFAVRSLSAGATDTVVSDEPKSGTEVAGAAASEAVPTLPLSSASAKVAPSASALPETPPAVAPVKVPPIPKRPAVTKSAPKPVAKISPPKKATPPPVASANTAPAPTPAPSPAPTSTLGGRM